jgi:hypothetical protein
MVDALIEEVEIAAASFKSRVHKIAQLGAEAVA